jgi:S-adenosylmethionine-diacylglycerol 3-amino-3-carboxypropyl transferase
MTKKYFQGLNYTLGNEDTTVEIALVDFYKPTKVFSVCGSGGRALPLAGNSVIELTLIDLSPEQILLAKLREATYKQLSYHDFLVFWGYFPFNEKKSAGDRKNIFKRLSLEAEVFELFQMIFEEIEFSSILYLGKWERTFSVLAKINRKILGSDYDGLFKFDRLSDQRLYYANKFPKKRWRLVVFMLGNKALFNALLYKGHFIKKNVHGSHFDFYVAAFERLFTNCLARNSFFLNLCFYGQIHSNAGIPVEAQLESYTRIKESTSKIFYLSLDLVTHLSLGNKKYDFLSLSDVPSYFLGDLEVNYMQKIKPSLLPGAIVVIRYYLRIAHCDLSGFVDVTTEHQEVISAEKVQMYDIRVYQFNS